MESSAEAPVADILHGMEVEVLDFTALADETEAGLDNEQAKGGQGTVLAAAVAEVLGRAAHSGTEPVGASSAQGGAGRKAAELTETLRSANGPPSDELGFLQIASSAEQDFVRALSLFAPMRPLLFLPGIGGTFAAAGWENYWYTHRGIEPTKLQVDPIGGTYEDLIQTLDNVGYTLNQDLFIANYDWRMPPGPKDGTFDGVLTGLTAPGITDGTYETGVDYLGYWLEQASDSWAANHSGVRPSAVDVIGHSTGNLVIRAYLQSGGAYGGVYDGVNALPKVNHFVSLSAPYRGSALPWNLLHDDWNSQATYRIVFSQILNNAYKQHQTGATIFGPDGDITPSMNLSHADFIEKYAPTVRGLLATYDFLDTDGSDGQDLFTDVNGSAADRNWLLLDLNDGLDKDYELEDLSTVDWAYHPTVGPVRKPTDFINKLLGNLTVVYSLGRETFTNAVEHVGPVSALDEVQPFDVFLGSLPSAGQTWYEETYLTGRKLNGDGVVPKESLLELFERSVGERDPNSKLTLAEVTIAELAPCEEILGHSGVVSAKQAQKILLDGLVGAGNYADSLLSLCGQYSDTVALANAIALGILNPLQIAANIDITSVKNLIKDGIDRLAFLAKDVLNNAAFMQQNVPIVNKPLDQLLNVSSLVDSAINPLTTYLNGLVGTLSVQQLLDKLHEYALVAEGMSYFGFVAPGQVFFTIPITKALTSSETINLGTGANALGLGLDVNANYDARAVLSLDLSIGVDLSSTLPASDRFFIRQGEVRADISVDVKNLAISGHFGNSPPIVFNVVEGEIDLAGSIISKMVDPSPNDGKITLTELNAGTFGSLFDVTAEGTLEAQFPLTAQLGGFSTALFGIPTLEVTSSNLFGGTAPAVSVSIELNPALQQRIIDILDQLGGIGDYVSSLPVLNTPLPFLSDPDRDTLNELLYNSPGPKLGDFVKLKQAAQDYLGLGGPNSGGLLKALIKKGIELAGDKAKGNFAFGPLEISGGLYPVDKKVIINVKFDFVKTGTVTVDETGLDIDAAMLGLAFSTVLDYAVDLKTAFSMALDLNNYLTNPTAGILAIDTYLTVDQLSVKGSINATNLNMGITVAFLNASVVNGTLALEARADFKVNNGNPMTLSALISTPIATLVALTPAPTGMLHAELPITASIGSTNLTVGCNPKVIIDDPNLFATPPPLITTQDFACLADFANLNPLQVLSALRSLGNWFAQYRDADLFNVKIPFTSGRTLGSFFDFSKTFIDGLYSKLVTMEQVAEGMTSAVRASGRITSDAKFTLQLDANAAVAVVVSAASTSANSTLEDLVADFNFALAATALNGLVVARLNEKNQLVLAAATPAASLKLVAEDGANSILTQLGFSDNSLGLARPNFDGIQEFLDQVAAALDPDGPGMGVYDVMANYNAAKKEVTLKVTLNLAFSKTVPFSVEPDLPLGDLVEVMASGTLAASGSMNLDFTLGFSLAAKKAPELISSYFIPVPSNGRLTADAHFGLRLNQEVPVNLVLLKTSTTGNTSVDDLVADFNALFAATTLPSSILGGGLLGTKVHAYRLDPTSNRIAIGPINEDVDGDGKLDVKEDLDNDGFLNLGEDANNNAVLDAGEDLDGDGVLDALNEDVDRDGVLDVKEDANGNSVLDTQLGVINTLRIFAADDDPIVTEVGFSNQEVARAEAKGLFIENASVNGSVTLSATGITTSARLFDFIEISTSGGTATATASVGVTLKNPNTTSSETTRLYLPQLFKYLDSASSAAQIYTFSTPLTGSVFVSLGTISIAAPFQYTPAGSATITVFIPNIKHLQFNPNPYSSTNNLGIFVTYPDFSGLINFKCFGFSELASALDALVDNLKGLQGFGFLDKKLPLVGKSISDLMDYGDRFADLLADLRSDPTGTIQEVEAAIEAYFGWPASVLTMSIDSIAEPKLSGGADPPSAVAATAGFNPRGQNNHILFTAESAGAAANGIVIRFVDDDTFTGTTNGASADYDAANRVVTVKINGTYTTAQQVIDAINTGVNAASIPVTASSPTSDPDGGTGNDGSGVITTSALKVSLSYSLAYGDGFVPFQFNAGELVELLPDSPAKTFLNQLSELVQIEGSGQLNVTASAALTLDFGVDLTNSCRPVPFLYDTTGLSLKARVLGTNLTFKLAAGPLGIFLKDGKVTVDKDGDPATQDDAEFTVVLKDNDGDGRHYFRSLFDETNLDVTLAAGASARLPIYAPFQNTALGGTGDVNLDGYPDNEIVVDIPDLKRVFKPYVTANVSGSEQVTIRPVGGNNDFVITSSPVGMNPAHTGVKVKFLHSGLSPVAVNYEAGTNTLNITLNHGNTVANDVVSAFSAVAGDGFSAGLDLAESGGNTGLGKVKVPVLLIGPDFGNIIASIDLCDLVTNAGPLLDGLDKLLERVQNGLTAGILNSNFPLVGKQLGKAANFIGDFRSGLLQNLRNELATVGGDPLGLVRKAIFNALGKGPRGLNLLVKYSDGSDTVNTPDDVEVICTNGEVVFQLRLKKSLAVVDTSADPIRVDIGRPGLGLTVEGNVLVELSFDLKLKFGINRSEGFYLDTSASPELFLGLKASIPGLAARGTLAFLQLDVTDDAADPSTFIAGFQVDLKDPVGSNNHLTFADLQNSSVSAGDIVEAALVADANINLDLVVSFEGNADFPRILADFALDWHFADLEGGEPTIAFNNVRVDVGTFISKFVLPILKQIRKVTEPLDPLVKILAAPLPVISDLAGRPYTLVDLAELFGYVKPGTAKFIKQVVEIVSLINDFNISSATLEIPIGSFTLVGGGETDPGTIQAVAPSNLDLKQKIADIIASNPSQNTPENQKAKSFIERLSDKTNFSFPWLKNPAELFKLFVGKPVSLIEYRMPVLEFNFTFRVSYAIYPPLYVVFGGGIGAKIDLTFGYDTLGLQKFFSSKEKDPLDLLDGFYVKDLNDAGEDVPELTLSGSLTAGAEINLTVAQVGVQGGIFATVDFNLNDPDQDGKVRIKEIIANAKIDLRCIFDVHGKIDAGLEVFLKVDLFVLKIDKVWRIATITLFEFDITCPKPVLATVSSGLLTLNMGPNAGGRGAEGWNDDTSDNAETFTVSHLSGSAGDETVRVKWNGYTQDFEHVNRVYGHGGNGNDTVDASTVLAETVLDGGDGADTLYGGQGVVVLHGNAGNDQLYGAAGNDMLYGDDGTDTISGGNGGDTIEGGGGPDVIMGEDGDDTLRGGDGADRLLGGEGLDLVYGDDGNDILFGGYGADRMVGGLGDDVMQGDAGNDVLVGDLGTIVSALAVVGISGIGNDLISGGSGVDVLFGGGGNDQLFGGTLLVNGSAAEAEADGNDFIDGGGDADTIFADDGHADMSDSALGITIGDWVWYDANMDGRQDANESGVAHVPVNLRKVSDGTIAAAVMTDSSGKYQFVGINPGSYFVEFIAPSGLAFTVQNAGSDDAADSDATVGTGVTAGFAVSAGQKVTALDAGLSGPIVITIREVSVSEGNAGRALANFEVALSAPGAEPVTVCYDTESHPNGAVAGVDYLAKSSTLTFAPGETAKTISVEILGDRMDEPNETFRVKLTTPHNAVLDHPVSGATSAIGMIVDDDLPPTITISDSVPVPQPPNTPVPEQTTVVFTVRLSNPSSHEIRVDYNTTDATAPDGTLAEDNATDGIDYSGISVPVTLVFAPGVVEQSFSINTNTDALDELDERFLVVLNNLRTLSSGTPDLIPAASISRDTGTGKILDDDASPTANISDLLMIDNLESVTEGHATLRDVTFKVTLSAVSGLEVKVNWATSRGTAADFSAFEEMDFVHAGDSVVFAPGETTKTVTVQVKGDTLHENPDEYFFVNLLSASNAVIGSNHGVVTVLDDDPVSGGDLGPWAIQFSQLHYSVVEGNTMAEITLFRTAGSTEAVGVFYTLAGTATAGADYTTVRTLVRFADGETTKTVWVPILDDVLVEGDETVLLYLRNPTGGNARGELDHAILTIVDNEPLPEIAISDAVTTEGAIITCTPATGSPVTGLFAEFTVTLAPAPGTLLASGYTVTVQYATTVGTAKSPADFAGASATTLTLTAASPVQHICVGIVDDTTAEVTEDFHVNLANASANATMGDGQGLGTIHDNDKTPVVGVVFVDANGNGVFDGDDHPLEGATVSLKDAVNAAFNVTTNASGLYSGMVLMGSVRVSVDESTLPEGLILSTNNNPQTVTLGAIGMQVDDVGYKVGEIPAVPSDSIGSGGGFNNDTVFGGSGNDTIDGGGGNDFIVGGGWLGPGCACEGTAYDAVVAVDGGGRLNLASLPPLGTQSGFVKDTSGTGMAGARVDLYSVETSGEILVGSVITGADGGYSFPNLTPCDYKVVFSPPLGYDLATPQPASFALNGGMHSNDATIATITPTAFQFSQGSYAVGEHAGLITITVLRAAGYARSTVVYTISNGTAISGADYRVSGRGLLSFGPTELSKTFTIQILADSILEGEETIHLSLRDPTGAPVPGDRVEVDVRILDAQVCPDDDVLTGGDGNDRVLADYGWFYSNGFAVVLGGLGNDQLFGGEGNDYLNGEGGSDALEGGAGDDEMDGGAGDDRFAFDADKSLGSDALMEVAGVIGGVDVVDFGATTSQAVAIDLSLATGQIVNNNLTLTFAAGDVVENVSGGALADRITGNSLNNTLAGGDGDDVYRFDTDTDQGSDMILEGLNGGLDTVDFSATHTEGVLLHLGLGGVQVVNGKLKLQLPGGARIENAIGGSLDDVLTGNLRANQLQGGPGMDILNGGAGDDVLWGGPGNDTLNGNFGNDTVREERDAHFTLSDVSLAIGAEVDSLSNIERAILVGGISANTLDASAFTGSSTLDGREGPDTITGGAGNDFLTGGEGDDTIQGGAGLDQLMEERDANFTLTDASLGTGAETDTLGGIEDAKLTGGESGNTLDATGFTGRAELVGAGGNDALKGGSGSDILEGGTGDDTLTGGAGDDTYRFDADSQLGSDTIDESGGGVDTLDFSRTESWEVAIDLGLTTIQTVNANLKVTLGLGVIENATGGVLGDTLRGNSADNRLIGGGGDDLLAGGAGMDTLLGNAGADVLDGGLDADVMNGGAGVDRVVITQDADFVLTNTALTISGGAADTLISLESADLTGGAGNNLMDASAFTLGPVRLDGAGGDDDLRGGSGADVLVGGAGDDLIAGGAGDDTYLFDTDSALGIDVLDESGGGIDSLDFSGSTSLAVSVDLSSAIQQTINANLKLAIGSGVVEGATGSALGDILIGNNASNTLIGGAGHDVMLGRGGADELFGNDGNDTLEGGGGDDLLVGGTGGDFYLFDADSGLGSDEVDESAEAEGGIDTLDFSLTTTMGLTLVDLSLGTAQALNANLTLTIVVCDSVEIVTGN